MKKLLVLSILGFCLLGCEDKDIEPNEPNNPNEEEKVTLSEETKTFKEEYEALNDSGIEVNITEGNVVYLDQDELLMMLTEGTGIIYFGFPSCPWCRNIVPILLSTNETIYYFNTKTFDKKAESYTDIREIVDPYLTLNEEGVKTLYVPDVYFVKSGEIVGNHLGSVDSQTDPYELLTSTQKEELLNIYKDLINKIK